MPATPVIGLRYPENIDAAKVWLDIQNLAEDVEAAFIERFAVNVRDYGAVGNAQIDNLAAATDDTVAIQAAMDVAAASGRPLWVPPGVPTAPFLTSGYKVSASLVMGGVNVMINGSGLAGKLMFTTTQTQEWDWLELRGPGDDLAFGGYCKDLHLEAYTVHAHGATTATAKIGLKLHKRCLFEVTNVTVANSAVSFELEDNCFGTKFTKCSNASFGSHVGMNINGGAGNDVKCYGCWFTGDYAALFISGNTSGFAFRDGQLAAGHGATADDDDTGVVVIGKDYRTGTVGGDVTNCTIEGFDVEAFPHRWFLRTYSQIQLSVRDCLFLSTGTDSTGIWYGTDTNSCRLRWENCRAVGNFTHATAFEFDGTLGSFAAIDETNTRNDASYNSVLATDFKQQSFLVQSQTFRGRAYLGGGVEMLGKLLLRHNELTDAYEKSTNWGSSWTAV